MFDRLNTHELAQHLGEQLKAYRISRHDRQSDMAVRIGVSTQTYSRMENGDTKVALDYWLRVVLLAGFGDRVETLLTPEPDLFAELELADKEAASASKPKRVRKHG